VQPDDAMSEIVSLAGVLANDLHSDTTSIMDRTDGFDEITLSALGLAFACVDLIATQMPDISAARLRDLARPKLSKWVEKAAEVTKLQTIEV
jgi:hypothetical protein